MRGRKNKLFCAVVVMICAAAIVALLTLTAKGEDDVPGDAGSAVQALRADEPMEALACVDEPMWADEASYVPEIPLDEMVQELVFRLCDERGIDPAIVFAMIWRESRYNADAIGDKGAALGLLQIWPKWHSERMDKLGVTNLLDPMQNVIVGMDYLAELLAKGNGLEWAISAYNNGATGADKMTARGIKSEYAADVLAEAGRIEANVLQR